MQDLPEEADAIVIGAGVAGLSLAVLLGNFGRKACYFITLGHRFASGLLLKMLIACIN